MLIAKRIWDFNDVAFILNGLNVGIGETVFTSKTLMEQLKIITSKDVTFYLFAEVADKETEKGLLVGFGGIKNLKESKKSDMCTI